jgi:hypothetical protein
MAIAPKRLRERGTGGGITAREIARCVRQTKAMLGLSDVDACRRYNAELLSHLTFYQAEVQKQTARHMRDEIHEVTTALEALIVATRPASSDREGGLSDTARAKIASAMRRPTAPFGAIEAVSGSFDDFIRTAGIAYLDVLAIDEQAKAEGDGVKPPTSYDGRANALADLGKLLIRTYERFHHAGKSFRLGMRVDLDDPHVGTKGSTFETEAYEWFTLVIRGLVPDIRGSEIIAAAKAAYNVATLEKKGASTRCAYALAVFCIATGSAIPATPDEHDVPAMWLAGWLNGWR